MPEPISILPVAPQGAGAAAPSAADQRAAEASPFDAMLQAGLSRQENSGARKAPESAPAESRPAKDKTGTGDPAQDAVDADPLVALLAYGAADITAALLASASTDPAAAARRHAAAADPEAIQTAPDQNAQAAAPVGAQLRAIATKTDTLLDPSSFAKVSGQPATAPGEPKQGGSDAIVNRPAERAMDTSAAAQALAQDARSVVPQQLAAAGTAAANVVAATGTRPAIPADAVARKPGASETDDTAPAKRGLQFTPDAAPTAEGGVKDDRLLERRSDPRDAIDSAQSATVQRGEEKFAHVLKAQDPKTAERPLDISPRIEAVARTDAAPQAIAAQAPAAAARPPSIPQVHIEPHVGSSQWNRDFVSQVNLLVSHREPQAEIRVNPPQLGPVEVRIGLDGNQVSVTFTAVQPETRAAIENALPQLREMFADNGLALGNASVSAESSQQEQSTQPEGSGAGRFTPGDVADAEAAEPMRAAITRLVDTFA